MILEIKHVVEPINVLGALELSENPIEERVYLDGVRVPPALEKIILAGLNSLTADYVEKALKELSRKSYQLKVAVGKTGRLVILEGFPDDDIHYGLHEMTPELEEGEYNQKPGIYLADVILVNQVNSRGPDPDDITYLEIVKFTEV